MILHILTNLRINIIAEYKKKVEMSWLHLTPIQVITLLESLRTAIDLLNVQVAAN